MEAQYKYNSIQPTTKLKIFFLILSLLVTQNKALIPKCPKGCSTCGEHGDRLLLPSPSSTPVSLAEDTPLYHEHEPKKSAEADKSPEHSGSGSHSKEHGEHGEHGHEEHVACRTCKQGYRLKEHKCHPCDIKNCAKCDENKKECQECRREYFKVDNHKCEKCPEKCEYCADAKTCDVCILGHVFDKKEIACKMTNTYRLILFLGLLALMALIVLLILLCRRVAKNQNQNSDHGHHHGKKKLPADEKKNEGKNHKEKNEGKNKEKNSNSKVEGKSKKFGHELPTGVLMSEESRKD
jgi:hypothetical protein